MAKSGQLIKAIAICSHTNVKNGADGIRYGADFVGSVKRFSKNAIRNDWVELPVAVDTKLAALEFLKAHADFQAPADQAIIDEKMHTQLAKSSKGTKSVKASKSAVGTKAKAKATETVAE